MEIIVSPLAAVQLLVNKHKVGHVVSLLGPETPHRSFSGIADANHLKLTWTLPSSAGNSFQGLSETIALTLSSTQRLATNK